MPIDHGEFRIVKKLDMALVASGAGGGIQSDEGPEEMVAFDYGKLGDQTFDDLAVDPNNPNVDWSSAHTGGANFAMGDGSVRFLSTSITDYGSNDSIWIDMGAPPADAGYLNTSSFQIISAGNNGGAEHGPSHQGWGPWELNPGGTIGGVSVASGDVDGAALGDPVTFTYTVRNTGETAMGDGSVRFLSDGLLLPAVQTDDGEAAIPDGTSNTMLFNERSYGPGDGDRFIFIDLNANGSAGLVVLGADTNVTGHTPEWSNLRSSSDPMETPGPDDDADDGLLLPAVQDDGLLLPAVQTDDGLLLPY